MLDLFNFPTENGNADIQIFRGSTTVTNLQWQTWQRPRGKSMALIMTIGAGGGGGGGFTGIAGAARGGGGGGACGGVSKIITPLVLLPEMLYIQAGAGGVGGSGSGVAGIAGVASYVCVRPQHTSNTHNIILFAQAGNGGAAGTNTGVAAGGTIGIQAGLNSFGPFSTYGVRELISGIAGGAGGNATGAVGAAVNPSNLTMVSPGIGGSGVTGTDVQGQGFAAMTNTLLAEIMPLGPSITQIDSGGGIEFLSNNIIPFLSFGGPGGASKNSEAGGKGGHAGFGSGGGGGGGGTTGGAGGNGGNGIVLIISW